jgi:hypothetical protein
VVDPDAYVRHVASTSKVFSIDGNPWQLRNRVLSPLWMPHLHRSVDRASLREIVRGTGAIMAMWNEGWDTAPSEWWYICCDDKNYDVSGLRKGGARRSTVHGLKSCEVRRLASSWFAENGYPVYLAAFRRYGTKPPLDESGFVEEHKSNARFAGRETWGAFRTGGGLVAWMSCIVVGDVVLVSSAKSNSAYHKLCPNNALLYTLTRHYLQEREAAYVTTGRRVILHDTNAQTFDEAMGYRKVYCHLRTELGWRGSVLSHVRPPDWIRRPELGRQVRGAVERLAAFNAAIQISQT